MRKTKIVCTLGPASHSEEMMEKLLRAGMNVARVNFSHGTHESHKEVIERFRAVRDRLNMPAAVLLDTKGPEIRLGDFEGGSAVVRDGEEFLLTTEHCMGDEKHVFITYDGLPRQLKPGNKLLIDDGKIHMQVLESGGNTIRCRVEHGGRLFNHKGVNVPRVSLDMPYLSEQDKADLRFGIENDVDFIAASFVRRADDVIQLRKYLNYYGGHRIRIIAKIENIEGVENFDAILEEADGIMVARGDMGVEVEYERLPGLQKRFIRRCYQSGKMVITATQMLESMIHSPVPTRAEITDVANAVFDGTSAVMLSGESAMGEYPEEAVKAMARISRQAEEDALELGTYQGIEHDMDENDTTNALCDAACTTAQDMKARAVISVTMSGYTARRMSKFRPKMPIVAATPDSKTYHQLSMSWGVYPVLARRQETYDALFTHAIDCACMLDIVKDGDRVVITGGVQMNLSGSTNVLRVETVHSHR